MRWAPLAVAVVAVGCAVDGAGPRIDAVTPPYGPLVGGTHVTVTGAGFRADGAPTRVAIGGREAPLAATVDDGTLEVLLPPGAQPGDVEVVVWNGRGAVTATGRFHYSAPPTLTGVDPPAVRHDVGGVVAVTGTGFVDEGAGDVTLVVGGRWDQAVEVISDTVLRVTLPPGRALSTPDLELVDGRGRATLPRAFRYVPSARPGLLLFPPAGAFAVFFDPVDATTVSVPAIGSPPRFTAVVRDEDGVYWGADRARRVGRVDLGAQTFDPAPLASGWFPTLVRVGPDTFGVERGALRFGRLDVATGGFTPIGADPLPCCGSYGLAAGAGGVHLTARSGGAVTIAPLDPATGALGAAVPLTGWPGVHVEEMRELGGTLYAASRDGSLVAIDPTTGAVTVVAAGLGRFRAMERLDPPAALAPPP